MGEGIRVLQVADDPDAADPIGTYLEDEDGRFSVETATDGAEGLDLLGDDVDCVVSDYDMAGMDGIEFLRAVREEYPDLPFVLFPADGSEAVASEALAAGATEYLPRRSGDDQYGRLATRIEAAVEQRRVDRDQRGSVELFERALRATATYVWEWDARTDEITRHPNTEPLFGVSSEAVGGLDGFVARIHPDERDRIEAAMHRGIDSGRGYQLEYRVRSGDDTWRWVRDRAEVVTAEDGTPIRAVGSITDLTEQKERERDLERCTERLETEVERLERAETRYRSLFESFPEPTFAYVYEEGEPHVAALNDSATEVFGYTAEEAVGERIDDLLVPPDRREEARRLDERVRDGDMIDEELRRQTADGLRSFRFRNIRLPEDDEIDGYAVYADITERKEREQDLERSRRRYRSLFENNPLVIWEEDFSAAYESLVELAGDVDDVEAYLLDNPAQLQRFLSRIEVIDVNRNALEYYNAPSKAALFERLDEVFTDEARTTFADLLARVARGETRFRGETVARTLDGQRKHELLEVFVPEEYADDYSRVYVTGTDITERKQQEQELRKKNERLEQFASVVSHDLRNPLTVLDGSLTLAEETGEAEHFRRARRAVGRMERLIEDLLTLAREGEVIEATEAVPLGVLAEECWDTVATAEARLDVATERVVRADPGRLKQLLENLFRNAIQHGGETVTITLGDADGGFYVADDGPGIPEADREAVFEFGYSTTENGTGFGLNIVEEVVDAHGWSIRLTDSTAGGARFEVTGVTVVE